MTKQKSPYNPDKTSIGLGTQDRLMLDYLCQLHDHNRSAMIRRLITEAYSIIKYVEQK